MNSDDLAAGLVEGNPRDGTFLLARPGEEPRPFLASRFNGAAVVASSIFQGTTYPIMPWLDAAAVETIVDVGANIGAASAWFRLHYPAARILSYEPHPEAYHYLAHNAAVFGYEPKPYGLWRCDRPASLHDGVPECGTVTASLAKHGTNTENMVAIELRDAGAELGPLRIDILKIDTEGAEVPILNALPIKTIIDTSVIYIEVHSEEDRLRIDSLLSPSHILFSGTIFAPHKAELVYARRALLPASYEEQAFRLEEA